jgi:hypothetical protein
MAMTIEIFAVDKMITITSELTELQKEINDEHTDAIKAYGGDGCLCDVDGKKVYAVWFEKGTDNPKMKMIKRCIEITLEMRIALN